MRISAYLVLSAFACLCMKHANCEIDGDDNANPDELQAQADALRRRIQYSGNDPDIARLHLELAVTLQQLNQLKPDGGKRILEAEKAYRRETAATGITMSCLSLASIHAKV